MLKRKNLWRLTDLHAWYTTAHYISTSTVYIGCYFRSIFW